MKKKGARKVSRNTKQNEVRPKRKIGRYVLIFLLALPAFMQLRHVDMSLPKEYLPEIEMPKISFSSLNLPSINFSSEVKFTNVIVDGDLIFSSKEELQKQLSKQLKIDFVRLDLDDIQASLLKNPWYRKVSVSRVWPSSLEVKFEEEQPIARWGNVGFVNRYGEVVLSDQLEALTHLPLLQGDVSEAYEIAKSYLTVSQLLIDQQLYITKLRVSDSGAWSLEINHAFSLSLGDKGLSSRIERFIFLYEKQLAPLIDDVEQIDMRYRSGVAVKWKKHTLAAVAANNTIASR